MEALAQTTRSKHTTSISQTLIILPLSLSGKSQEDMHIYPHPIFLFLLLTTLTGTSIYTRSFRIQSRKQLKSEYSVDRGKTLIPKRYADKA